MKIQVIGIERKTGDFSPKDKPEANYHFDNFVLHSVGQKLGVAGQTAMQLSLKVEHAGELIAQVGGEPKNLIGHVLDVDVLYGKKIVAVEILK